MKRDCLLGVVVIGRNEGERLKRCLSTVLENNVLVVYVDSGSSDGSPECSASLGCEVLELDMSLPFSAARARNEGFKRLMKIRNEIEYVQFVDGDCELNDQWLSVAHKYLQSNEECAIVAGRVKERFPEKSIYNYLCEIEWNTSVGDVQACGGIFLCRVSTFKDCAGFNQSVIAGEEPELCYRMKKLGWRIHRLSDIMVHHDAALYKYSQWWTRTVRSGYAYAQVAFLHGFGGKAYRVRECARIWLWAFVFPIVTTILMVIFSGYFIFIGLLVYLVQFVRMYISFDLPTIKMKYRLAYSFYSILGKFPQFLGQIKFLKDMMMSKSSQIIEYK